MIFRRKVAAASQPAASATDEVVNEDGAVLDDGSGARAIAVARVGALWTEVAAVREAREAEAREAEAAV